LAPVPRGTVDVAKAIDTVAAATPQAVLYIGQSKPAAALIRGVQGKGVHPQFFVLSVASGLHADLGAEASGVIVSQVVPYPFTELGHPVVRDYQKTIGALDDKGYSYNSMEGYLNAKLVAAALLKTPPPLTRAKLISTLQGLNNEDLGGFAISYGKQSNLGSRFVALTMIRKDGTFAR
jgi:ABC-type branched-subunit amino acid transport system substrate-binding protein